MSCEQAWLVSLAPKRERIPNWSLDQLPPSCVQDSRTQQAAFNLEAENLPGDSQEDKFCSHHDMGLSTVLLQDPLMMLLLLQNIRETIIRAKLWHWVYMSDGEGSGKRGRGLLGFWPPFYFATMTPALGGAHALLTGRFSLALKAESLR